MVPDHARFISPPWFPGPGSLAFQNLPIMAWLREVWEAGPDASGHRNGDRSRRYSRSVCGAAGGRGEDRACRFFCLFRHFQGAPGIAPTARVRHEASAAENHPDPRHRTAQKREKAEIQNDRINRVWSTVSCCSSTAFRPGLAENHWGLIKPDVGV